MAVYYKFKSAKDFDSVATDGHFISVGNLKEKIFELKHLGRGTDYDLVVTNAQTNEEYLDDGMLIPKNTSVLIRRLPGRPRKPIVTAPVTEQEKSTIENISDDVQAVKGSLAGAGQSSMKYAEDLEWDEFGNDLYAMPETVSVLSSNPVNDSVLVSMEDEESKIKALIDTPALDWQRQPSDSYGLGRGFGRGMGGRMMAGRGFGRGGFEKKTPPQGYICHRCKVPGHFIQHCPTNGDPNFDIKRVKPPTGIPKSMLMATPDGSYALPSGAVAVLKPNEAAFEKEIEGMPSTRSIGELPPKLHCPLCKEVMKDAVLTSKCCLISYCDKCIRDHIISKSMCVCGATNILADDLLPNKTVRDTINSILESNNNSAENVGSAFQPQDMESHNPQAKVPSPTHSAASKGQHVPAPPPQQAEIPVIVQNVEEYKAANELHVSDNDRVLKVADESEATHESKIVKEAASLGPASLADEEAQQKPISGEAGKKKKKRTRATPGAADMQWRGPQDFTPENYMMHNMGPSGFNSFWNGMQPGVDGFMPPYGGPMPYMGFGFNPMDVAFGGVLPHDPYVGSSCMLPYGPPPQRDLAELAMGFNAAPPVMSREEFEGRKADLRRKREMERREEMESSKDREYGREGSSTGHASSRPKSKSNPHPHPSSAADHHQHRSERRLRDPELPHPSSKKRSEYIRRSESPPQPELTAAENCRKASVFSRISFPGHDPSVTKKRKTPSEEHKVPSGSRKSSVEERHESSGDERHFKRRPSRYNSSPPPAAPDEERHHSRGSRERASHTKHR